MQVETLLKGEKNIVTTDNYLSCNGQVPMNFYNAQLAPDGKIYLNTWGCARELHIIEKPDLPDTLCQVKQHALLLPTSYGGTMCNFPHFCLGAKDCTTPVSEVEAQKNILLYPNPAQNELTVEVSNIANTDVLKIRITTLTGGIVQENIVSNNEKIDISTLQNSLYFCTILKNNVLMTTN